MRQSADMERAGLNPATRPTGKQAYLNRGRLVMSGWTPQKITGQVLRILFEHDDLTYDQKQIAIPCFAGTGATLVKRHKGRRGLR